MSGPGDERLVLVPAGEDRAGAELPRQGMLTVGSSKERVARRMLRSREGDVEHGIPIVPTRDRITFDDAAEDLLNDTGPMASVR